MPRQPVIEIADRDSQRLGDAAQPPGGNTIDALLVFVGLLVGDPLALPSMQVRSISIRSAC